MDILFTPNVAYLLLVAGFWLAIIAVLTPGTGIIEIGALAMLLLAGWAATHLLINLWALALLLLGVIPFLIAVRRSGRLIYLVISIVAMVVGSTFLFREPSGQPAVSLILALFVSILTAGFLWIVTRKVLEAEGEAPTHDLTLLIGSDGTARTDIFQEGTVQIGSELWSAHSKEQIPAQSRVRVVGREGLILEVEKANHFN